MFSGMLAGFLKVAAVALVTGGFAGGIYWAVQVGGSDGSSAFGQTEPSVTVTITPVTITPLAPTDTPAPPTATALPPTQPPPTEPAPADVPLAATPDTRVAIMDSPTLDQIQLAKDGSYFIADRGDGCTWVEVFRGTITFQGEEILNVTLDTDCPADFFFAFRPETGKISLFMQ